MNDIDKFRDGLSEESKKIFENAKVIVAKEIFSDLKRFKKNEFHCGLMKYRYIIELDDIIATEKKYCGDK